MSASFTAYNIAVTLRNLGADSPCNRALVQYAADSPTKRLVRTLPGRWQLALMEWLFVPGMALHFLGRKKLIREQVQTGLAQGLAQIVQIGAGFDTLTAELSRDHPAITFIEMDLPATQQVKTHALQCAGIPIPPNLHFIPVDLAQVPLAEALKAIPAYHSEKPALFLFEGVLMYVPEAAVQKSFHAITQLHPQNQVLFGAMARPDSEGHLPQRLIARFLDLFGEKIRWVCPAGDMPLFLESAGLHLMATWPYAKIQEKCGIYTQIEDEHYYLAGTKNG